MEKKILRQCNDSFKSLYSDGKDDLPFWAGKKEIKAYLEKINENGKVSMSSHNFRSSPSF